MPHCHQLVMQVILFYLYIFFVTKIVKLLKVFFSSYSRRIFNVIPLLIQTVNYLFRLCFSFILWNDENIFNVPIFLNAYLTIAGCFACKIIYVYMYLFIMSMKFPMNFHIRILALLTRKIAFCSWWYFLHCNIYFAENAMLNNL